MKPKSEKSSPADLAAVFAPLIWLAVGLLALAVGAGLLAGLHPAFELATHFVLHYLVLGLALALVALLVRRYVAFALALGLGLSNLAPLWPYVLAPPPVVRAEGPVLRLITANLNYYLSDAAALEALLQSTDADIVVLTELGWNHEPVFARIAPLFPARLRSEGGRHHPFGLLVLARRQLRQATIHQPFGVDFPIIEFRYCLDEAGASCLAVIALHAVRPEPDGRQRDLMLGFAFERARLAGIAREQAIVVGDLNVTPWSPAFGRFAALGLRDAGLGWGWQPTWPAGLGPAGIPIDHVLVSPRLAVVHYGRLPAMKSDHFPRAVELRLPAAKPAH